MSAPASPDDATSRPRAWSRLVARLAHPDLLATADGARRTQLVIVLALLALTFLSVRAFMFLSSGMPLQSVVISACVAVVVVIMLLLRRARTLALPGNLMLGVLFAAGTASAIQRGGVGSTPLLAMAAIPLVAMFIGGSRWGAGWLAALLVEIAALAVAQASGGVLSDQLAPAARLPVTTIGAMLFAAALFAIGGAYEWTRKSALDSALASQLDAARAAEEARMARLERMAALGQLAAGVAHEINNPLSYVAGNVAVVHKKLASPEPLGPSDRATLMEAAAEARLGAARIGEIVRDLRTFVRDADDGAPVPCGVRSVVDSVLRLARRQVAALSEVEVAVAVDLRVMASEAKLAQVLLNLVLNAAQAMGSRPAADNRLRVAGTASEDEVCLTVKDNGDGMDEDTLRRATEPFFTTKPVGVGTGLGLSVCTNIVRALGGRLELESKPGVGTSVHVTLPRAPAAEPAAAPTNPPEPLERLRVLIIDDDVLVLRSLRRTLTTHDVVTCPNAEDALSHLADGHFDVVLCDMMMPRLSGAEVYERAVASRPDLAQRFVFMTGGVYGERERSFVERVELRALPKPITLEALNDALTRAPGP
jgi:signal transduction histidine kinase/CheY-like chemotaxis protein